MGKLSDVAEGASNGRFVVGNQFGYLLFWAGILAVASGLLGALAGEIKYRRERTGRQSTDTHS